MNAYTRSARPLPAPDFTRAMSVDDTVTTRIASDLAQAGRAHVRDRYVGGRRMVEVTRQTYDQHRAQILAMSF